LSNISGHNNEIGAGDKIVNFGDDLIVHAFVHSCSSDAAFFAYNALLRQFALTQARGE